jgi:hypothetical protein
MTEVRGQRLSIADFGLRDVAWYSKGRPPAHRAYAPEGMRKVGKKLKVGRWRILGFRCRVSGVSEYRIRKSELIDFGF